MLNIYKLSIATQCRAALHLSGSASQKQWGQRCPYSDNLCYLCGRGSYKTKQGEGDSYPRPSIGRLHPGSLYRRVLLQNAY